MANQSSINISIKGKSVELPCILIDNRTVVVRGRFLRFAGVMDDFLDPHGVKKPESIIRPLKERRMGDLFRFFGSFAAAVGEEGPPIWHQSYYVEDDDLAAIRVGSFDDWYDHDIKKQTRRRIRKAKELGITVRKVALDDQFIQGIVRIFCETPVRQGKPFWHYGKTFDQVKKEISTYANRSTFLGAYLDDELVGFSKLIHCEQFGRANQLLSMVRHRDKPVTNALVAELIHTCEKSNLPYLVYGGWSGGTLGDFKRSNGFKRLPRPRYYIPLTLRGRIALSTKLYKGFSELIPEPAQKHLLRIRQVWYSKCIIGD